MTVSIDWDRAELVCGELLAAFRAKDYPYGEAWALPQTFITDAIKDDPLTHARFLFYACHYMRGSIKSDYAVKQLVVAWEERPDLFDPSVAQDQARFAELDLLLARLLKYKHAEIARFWQENSRRLALHWDGDPRKIFDGVATAEDMYRRVTNKKIRGTRPLMEEHPEWGFMGFQEKMASMLAYFLMDAKLVADFSASPPVDFHLIRIMLATGILVVSKDRTKKLRYEHLTPFGIEVLETYGRTHALSLVELGNALWMLSVVLCARAPGNVSTGRMKGENGKKIHPEPRSVDWTQPGQVLSYVRTCATCPVEERCSLNVYSGPYYQVGELVFRARETFPVHEKLNPLLGRVRAQLAPRKLKGTARPKPAEPEQLQLDVGKLGP